NWRHRPQCHGSGDRPGQTKGWCHGRRFGHCQVGQGETAVILLMGIAGSGKGTQGKMLADARDLHLISMGEVLRMYVTGEQRERMPAGELLDDRAIIKIVDQVLSSVPVQE